MFGIGEVVVLMMMGVGGILSLLSFAFWVWMLVDCITNEPSHGNDKLVWLIVILLANFVGAAIYFFVRRPRRMELYSDGQKGQNFQKG